MSLKPEFILADLEQKGIWRILFAVENQEKHIRELLEIEGIGQGALYSALRILLDYGLVTENRTDYKTRKIKITPKGKQVAKKIREIQEILAETE